MQIHKSKENPGEMIEQRSDEWFELRKGKVTGTALGELIVKRGNVQKDRYWKLLADRLNIVNTDEGEPPMNRGTRLEPEAIEAFEKETGKKVTIVGMCSRDDEPSIAYSPDGLIGDGKIFPEGVEVKCLDSWRHLRAWFLKEVPVKHVEQVVQSFIVNEDQEILWFVFYDPRVTDKPLFSLELKREDYAVEIEKYLAYQIKSLAEIDEMVKTFF